ncbi:hypothetical protein [Nocardia thailandica]
MTTPQGLSITRVAAAEAAELVAAVTGTSAALPSVADGLRYLFATYRHGYDIGVRDSAEWRWGSAAFAGEPEPGRPRAGAETGLEQLRVYGTDGDIVVARVGDSWHGWRRRPVTPAPEGALAPRHRSYLVTVGRQHRRVGGFTRIAHGTGQYSVLPGEFAGKPAYAHTTEYFTADADTGAVRVAAVVWTGYGTDPATVEEN